MMEVGGRRGPLLEPGDTVLFEVSRYFMSFDDVLALATYLGVGHPTGARAFLEGLRGSPSFQDQAHKVLEEWVKKDVRNACGEKLWSVLIERDVNPVAAAKFEEQLCGKVRREVTDEVTTVSATVDFTIAEIQQTQDLLGKGAYASVYKAFYKGGEVAVKCFHEHFSELSSSSKTAEVLNLLQKEARLMCGLHHPHIVHLYGVYAPGTRHVGLVMEQMATSLHKRVKEDPALSLRGITQILHDITSALAYLHGRNIIHRDVSPSNTLLTWDKAPQCRWIAKLSDFATAKVVQTIGFDMHSSISGIVGTYAYLPYEALDKNPKTGKLEYSSAVDVYSVGAVGLYAVLREEPGATPRPKQSLLQLRVGSNHALYKVFRECLDDNPSNRPSSSALQIRLETLLTYCDQFTADKSSSQVETSTASSREGSDSAKYGSVRSSQLHQSSPALAAAEPVKIVKQPTVCITQAGREAKLECVAAGLPFPCYQWYKGKQAIKGGVSSVLYIDHATPADAGQYCCLVKNNVNHLFSERAEIQVYGPPTHFLGKVALVIGNQCYWGEVEPLHHAEADAAELASLLTSIDNNFKVVSLTNLTSVEMKAAVSYFISLLAEGVLGVFYFGGHGFEHNGENYLMPVDVGLEEAGDGPEVCIRAQDILRQMQEQKAKLSFLILDVCRTHLDGDQWHAKEVVRPTGLGNAIVAFACQSTRRTYERRSAAHGIYMTHLKEHICEKISLEDILKRTAKGIADNEAHDVQRASYVSSITDNLSLHDKVDCQEEPHRRYFDRMVSSWQKTHEEPSSLEIYKEHGLKVRLHFGAEFSNVLIVSIHHLVENPSIRQLGFCLTIAPEGWDCESGLELEQVDEKPEAKVDSTCLVNRRMQGLTTDSRQCYRIKNLQRLPVGSDLKITVRITYVIGDQVYNPLITHNCGRPLVANTFRITMTSARCT